MVEEKKYVWYVGYGSNLLEERFLCYITGKPFQRGGRQVEKCTDEAPPEKDKPFELQHGLYFAKSSTAWQNGGVAFITPNKDENKYTYARMWKVTEEQFFHIWEQEGKDWYNKKIDLGKDDEGVPIWTITNKEKLPFNKPSDDYLKTVIEGLKESFHTLTQDCIIKYLMETPGIKNEFKEEDLKRLF
ncbi:MAG: hypothetical protein O3C48_08260 [Crenarchaeota archaeon]|nr:hypothetical protein [Thermoproteota archaeon]